MRPTVTKERIYIDEVEYYGLGVVENHLQRYKWACSKLGKEDCVLDAGCGSGYGTIMMTKDCRFAVGFDISEEAIAYARFKQSKSSIARIEYHVADATKLSLPYVFEKVICIEMIEHLDRDGQNDVMRNIKAHMTPKSLLMITTPEKKGECRTEYHKNEFTADEFDAFLKQHFSSVRYDKADDYKIKGGFILAVCGGKR